MSTITAMPFNTFDPSTLKPQAVAMNGKNGSGKGKSVYLTPAGEDARPFALPEMYTTFAIKPNDGDGEGDGGGKNLNLELAVPEGHEIRAVIEKLNEWSVDHALHEHLSTDTKRHWYSELATQLANLPADARTQMGRYIVLGKSKSILHTGKADGKGGKYTDFIRTKVQGWFDYIDERHYDNSADGEASGAGAGGGAGGKDGGKTKKMVRSVTWKVRPVTSPLGERDTRFYLWLPQLNKYTDRLPITNKDGEVQIGADGKPAFRWVSPADLPSRSQVTVVVRANKLYVTDSFGFTFTADKVYIKATKRPTTTSQLEGADVASDLSADELLAALNAKDGDAPAPTPTPTPTPTQATGGSTAPTAAATTTATTGTTDAEPPSASGDRLGGRKRGVAATATDEEEGAGASSNRKIKRRNNLDENF